MITSGSALKFEENSRYPLEMVHPSDTFNPDEKWGTPGLWEEQHPNFRESDRKTAHSKEEELFLRENGYKVIGH